MGTHYRGEPKEVRALDAYIKLMRCATSVQGRLERRLARLGLTDSQFGVLEALLHLGPSPQHELGRALFSSRANITTVVDNLERRGLVRRERDREDRRSVIVHLTPAGHELIRATFPGQVQAIVEELSVLSDDEQEELGRLCRLLGTRGAAPAERRDANHRPSGRRRRADQPVSSAPKPGTMDGGHDGA